MSYRLSSACLHGRAKLHKSWGIFLIERFVLSVSIAADALFGDRKPGVAGRGVLSGLS
jgi:hypothetical protein